ncbi:ABC transporter permease [Nocardioides abyssi]|uniref:ABC transporter permease n=1 Tax=Nocardioides abyssi TaxID=3058370 RepID=A0ABT8ETG3_9ACTN|nr:ABC transporter permease [Nocardioides abyssi]MDN4161394.1 ABC transporter permease [Nocardioides abyssi]
MRTVLLASLRTHTRRYVAAAVAVVIGVAFVVVTGMLSASARSGMTASVGVPYAGADVVVTGLDGPDARDLVRDAAGRGDRAAVIGSTAERARVGGRLLPDNVTVGAVADDERLQWQEVREGRLPAAPSEVAVDVNAAKTDRVGLGDTVRLGAGDRTVEAEVVGLVDTPSAAPGTDFLLTFADLETFVDGLWVTSVVYAGPGADSVQDRTDGDVVAAADHVQAVQADVTRGVDVLAAMLLVFAAIALFVSVLVIANTFTILFAQRARDFALLRCVGATREQVLRSVRLEALALAVVASVTGVVAGTALGALVIAVVRRSVDDDVLGSAMPSARWYVAALATGLVVTLVAAWLPTRRATAADPLSALRPHDVDVRTTAGRVRVALGVVALAGGCALLALAMASHEVVPMLAGGIVSFSGLLLLGPVLVPAAVRLAGALASRLAGTPGRIATGNAVRNPRRTAATTASLLVGVTLTTAVLIGLASSRHTVEEEMDQQYPVDLTMTSDTPLPDDLLGDVRATSGVVDAVALPGTTARIVGQGPVTLLAAPRGTTGVLRGDAGVASPGPGEVWLPDGLLTEWPANGRVTLEVEGRTRTLSLNTGEGWGPAAVVAPATLAALTDASTPRAVWARADDGADAEDLAGDLDALAVPAGAELVSSLGERGWVDTQLDVLTATVVGLLGIAVVIALIGIGNTLGLSVLERGRENALLRALGLTRRQLRATLAVEGLLLSLVATVVGVVVGAAYAWVALRTMVDVLTDDAAMVLPWWQLALVVVVAGLAGLASSVLPTRRAVRTAPAAGLGMD